MNFGDANAHFDSWAALVGHGAPKSGPLLVDSGVIQVPHLEALSGSSPIVANHFPGDDIYEHADPLFGATFNKESLQKWQDDGAEVTLFYQLSASVGGWYGFSLAFSPVVSVNLSQPIPLSEFLTEWAWPLRGLVAAATGKREDISYMTCSPVIQGDTRPSAVRQFQVFNASIAQEPYTSSNSLQDKDISAIRLNEGDSLLELLRRWQRLRAAENPILNTYDITAVGPSQHPRARFLLLLQALEGLCGYEKRFEDRQLRFTLERESAVNQCEEKLDNRFFRFIKKNFPKRPPLGLDSVLREMLQALPVNVEAELTETALVKSVRSNDANVRGTLDAVRVARNDLSHGNRAFDRHELAEARHLGARGAGPSPSASRGNQRGNHPCTFTGISLEAPHGTRRRRNRLRLSFPRCRSIPRAGNSQRTLRRIVIIVAAQMVWALCRAR
jgi:ApeA N-terminal domain 1